MWMVDLGGARTGLLFAYWNMEVAHDKNRKHGGEMQSSGVVRAVT